jgi:hypothetical protein
MTLGYGIGLGLIGIVITVVGCYVLLAMYEVHKEDDK